MIAVTPNLRSIVDHDGAVILDISNNAMTTLDCVGAYVWQRLERGLKVEQIASELASDTGADSNTVQRDVAAFMEQLKAAGLLSGCMQASSKRGSESA